jgi:hypothetical protein
MIWGEGGTAVPREELQVGAVESPWVELEKGRVNVLHSFKAAAQGLHLITIQDLSGREHHEEDVVVRPVREGGRRRVAGEGCARHLESPDVEREKIEMSSAGKLDVQLQAIFITLT